METPGTNNQIPRDPEGEAILIVFPGVPQPKGRPRFGRGRTYTPASTRTYETSLKLAAQWEMQGREPLQGPLVMEVRAFFPIPESWSKKKRTLAAEGRIFPTARPDADNLLKTVDAFNGVVWADDSQVVDARVLKIYSNEPRLEIQVEPMKGNR